MKILIVKMSSLGDVVHTIPFVRVLKKYIPYADIDWVVNENYENLLKGNPDISEVISFKRRKWLNPFGFFINLSELKKFSRYLKSKKYDYVIDLQGLFKSVLIVFMAGGKKNIGFSNPREPVSSFYDEKIEGDYSKHAVLRYLDLLKPLNINWQKEDIEFYIPLKEGDIDYVNQSLESMGVIGKKYVVFAPFSRWKTKMWNEKNFKILADMLENRNLPVIFVGDKNESLSYEPKKSLIGRLSVNQLYYLMKGAEFVLTCDSGAMHIASASGTKIFAIFGPTSGERTGPFSLKKGATIIRKEGVECAPCFKRECNKSMECMDITAEEVLKIIEKEVSFDNKNF
ncbi:MAG: glycosyltransferase family 9 protein [Proteobacteria bacterium]|nr:glycosyltransferase family 9 protein [Pseudomonadota bacterium]